MAIFSFHCVHSDQSQNATAGSAESAEKEELIFTLERSSEI